MPQVALTTDIGEGYGRWSLGDDAALLGLVTGANVACGFHAGDPGIMRTTCASAVVRGVAIGAQVSYRDLHGFGRRYVAYERRELTDDLLYQIGALEAFARVAGGRVGFIRAHGALYNVAATDAGHAGAIVDAVQEYDASLPVLCLPDTEMSRAAEAAGLRVLREGFVDRGYTPEGLLIPRSEPGAMITDPQGAATRALTMVVEGGVDALVVHSDTEGAVAIATATREALESSGIDLVPVGV
jgi:5-oxoprolinase (ATP-hydrolysing) subunit A